jgi:hypothetical protein
MAHGEKAEVKLEEGEVKLEGESEVESFDIDEDEKKLVELMRKMRMKPKVESEEELMEFMKSQVLGTKEKKPTLLAPPPTLTMPTVKTTPGSASGTTRSSLRSASSAPETTVTYFKLPSFFGEPGKGEVNYHTWCYDIKCLIGKLNEDEILRAIRNSAKGEAANVMTNLGVDASLTEVMKKFESIYGDIETPESIMKTLYACHQKKGETIVKYASRIEDIYAKAVQLGAVTHGSDMLKKIFYDGMLKPLKHNSVYQFHTIANYDDFKVEVRRIEKDLEIDSESTKCQAINKPEKPEGKSELTEVKELLEKMNERIKKLEEEKDQTYTDRNQWQYNRGFNRGRGFRGRGNNQRGNRGRGSFRPRRPTGSNTFKPANTNENSQQNFDAYVDTRKCYQCGQEGHIAKYCQGN